MKLNRNKHSRFVQQLDRTAEKNPILWLPCILLIALALAGEHIAEYVQIVYSHRNTEKIVKEKPQLERKPFALRAVAMSLTMALSFMFVPNLSNIIETNVYAYVTNGEFVLDDRIDWYDVIMYKGFADIVYVPSESNGKPIEYISGFDTANGYIGAFQGTTVQKVILPNSIYGIYDSAFKNCRYLESINIPDVWASGKAGRGSIGPEAFMNCSSLSSVSIPASIQQIYGHSSYNGSGVFENCTQLTSAIFPNEVDMLNNGYYMGSRCFAGCTSLKDVNLPILKADDPKRIGVMNNVFENCTSLEEISIPDGYKYINDEAFLNCSNLIKITIPESVTNISENAFSGCDNLIIYGYSNSYAETYANENGILFVALGESTKKSGECGENAHWDLSDDGTLTISGYGNMYDYDYYEGTSVPNLPYLGDYVSALDNAKKIKNVVFRADSNITYIGRNAFSQTGITSLYIPISVKSIGTTAFSDCESLTEITLPKTLSSINYGCFLNCRSLKKITILNPTLEIGEIALGYETLNVSHNDVAIYNDVVIYGYKDSTAETYANKNGILFTALDSSDDNTIAFSNFSGDKYSVGTDVASPIIANFAGKGEISENDISVFADDDSIVEITSININVSNKNTDNQQTWIEIRVRGLALGEFTNLNLTYNGITYSVPIEVVAVLNPQRFEISRDNFSFINSSDYFGNSYNISKESLLKLLNSTNENIVKAYIIKNSKKNFRGSCNGMSKVAAIMYADKLRLPTHRLLGNDFYNIETAKLSAPINSYIVADLINYYHLSQFLPFEQNKKFDRYVVNPQNVISCLQNSNTPVCVSIQNYDSEKNEYKNGHMILLTEIIEETESYYIIKCYDPSLTNDEQGNLKIYKNSLYNDKISIDYKWSDPLVEWNVIIKVLSNIDEIDYKNYFSSNIVSPETYNENMLILNNTARLYMNMIVEIPSKVQNLINDGVVNPEFNDKIVGPISTDSFLSHDTSLNDYIYYIDKNISDDFKITLDKNNENSDVYFVLDNYSFSLTTNGALEFNVNDISGSAQVTANDPSDFNLQLTSNDNFGGWKWFTVDVDVDNSTEFELAPTDEGIVVSGDNLSDITINANDEVDNTSIQFSTSEESVLIKNSEEDELEIYADTDNNGTYETLISDDRGATYSISIPQNVSVKRGGSFIFNDAVLHTGDVIVITADEIQGLKLNSINVNGIEIINGDTYTVGNENIIITVEYTEIIDEPTPDPNINPYSSKNIGSHDYINGFRSAQAIKSYLTEKPNNSLERLEYIENRGVAVETYLKDGRTVSQKLIPAELLRFGGFFSGSKYNFLVFGQDNPNLYDNVEVMRVVKYTKNWERLDAFSFRAIDSKGYCGIDKAETKNVFSSGTLRMAESGDNLIIHTCHHMFNGHQSNMPFIIKQSDMTFVKFAGFYTSHSFNQFVKTDSNFIYYVDHGDAYPRAVVLGKLPVDLDSSSGSERTEVIKINGEYDAYGNDTGVSIGGFELSDTGTVMVGNSVDQSDPNTYSPYGQRNIFFISTTNKLADFNIKWLTNYSRNIKIGNPHLVKISGSRFAIMWEEALSENNTVVKYLTVDNNGNILTPAVNINTRLSDCQPILISENKIMWYYTNNSAPIFVTIDLNGNIVNDQPVIPPHTHSFTSNWNYDSTFHWHECTVCGEHTKIERHNEENAVVTVQPTTISTGVRTYYCSVCGYAVKTETIPVIDDDHTIHTYGANWHYDSASHWHECTVCGVHSDTGRHNENSVAIAVQPTATTSGTRTYSCSVCGYTVRTETIPPINDPNPPHPTPIITYPTNTDTNTASPNEPYIYGDTSKSGWDTIISEIDFAADGSTVRVNMNGTYELPQNVVSRIQNRNINLELHCGGAVWTINGLDVTNPKTVNMRVSDRYNKIPSSIIDGLNSELKAIELRLYHSGDFGFKATLTFGVGKKYNNYYGALYHYNTKTKQLEFVDESLAAHRQITFEFTHASYYAVAFNSVPIYDDISSGAGVTADSIPIDFAIPTSDGVTIPAIKLPQIMKYSGKKRRYRILKKRRLDDLVFVL